MGSCSAEIIMASKKGGKPLFKNFSRRHRLDYSESDLKYEYIPQSLRYDVYKHLSKQCDDADSSVAEYCLYRGCSVQVNWDYFSLGDVDSIMEWYSPDLFIELLQKCSWHDFLSIIEFLIDQKLLSIDETEELFTYHCIGYEVSADEDGNQIVVVKYDQLIEDTDRILEGNIEFQGVLSNLEAAKKALSDRQNIDLCNSIKNSVNALEAYLIGMLNDSHIKTLGNAISKIRKTLSCPPHVLTALDQFYRYRNATENVGHGAPRLADLACEDALLCHEMAISLINYFHRKGNR